MQWGRVLDAGLRQIILKDLGVSPLDLLRKAHLPLDLFSQSHASLSANENIWKMFEPEFKTRLAHLRQTSNVQERKPA